MVVTAAFHGNRTAAFGSPVRAARSSPVGAETTGKRKNKKALTPGNKFRGRKPASVLPPLFAPSSREGPRQVRAGNGPPIPYRFNGRARRSLELKSPSVRRSETMFRRLCPPPFSATRVLCRNALSVLFSSKRFGRRRTRTHDGSGIILFCTLSGRTDNPAVQPKTLRTFQALDVLVIPL